jgi:hypothetical protein
MKWENQRKRYLTYSIPKLKEVADKFCSEFIRRKYTDWKGETQCYTCPAKKRWQEMQNGHYNSRIYINTRYYEPNLRPQCYRCNVLLKGNYTEFSIRLERETPGILKVLDDWKHRKSEESTRYELLDLIEGFKNKINELTRENN